MNSCYSSQKILSKEIESAQHAVIKNRSGLEAEPNCEKVPLRTLRQQDFSTVSQRRVRHQAASEVVNHRSLSCCTSPMSANILNAENLVSASQTRFIKRN